MDITYDVEEGIIHERLSVGSVEIDRWITPDRTVAQSVDTDIDRIGRWRTETVGPVRDSNGAFTSYPLKKTTVPALLASAMGSSPKRNRRTRDMPAKSPVPSGSNSVSGKPRVSTIGSSLCRTGASRCCWPRAVPFEASNTNLPPR